MRGKSVLPELDRVERSRFMEAPGGAAEHSYPNPSASCQARGEGAAVCGLFYGIRSCASEGGPGVLVAGVRVSRGSRGMGGGDCIYEKWELDLF